VGPEPVWTWCRREKCSAPPGFEPRSSDRPARSQSLYYRVIPALNSRPWVYTKLASLSKW